MSRALPNLTNLASAEWRAARAASVAMEAYAFSNATLQRHDRTACFSGTTQHARTGCGNFWHSMRGNLVPTIMMLRKRDMLHPSVRLIFESQCSKMVTAMYSVLFDAPPQFGVPLRNCPARAARFEFDSRALEEPKGMLDCAGFAARAASGRSVRRLHRVASYRLGLPLRSREEPLKLLYSARVKGRRLTNRELLEQALGAIASAYGATSKTVVAEQLPASEQMRAFASADIALAFHGATISHVLWMPPDSVFVEIQPSDVWHCAGAFQLLPLTYVIATSPRASTPGTCVPGRRRQSGGEVTPAVCAQKCTMFDVASTASGHGDVWRNLRNDARAADVNALDKFVRGILEHHRMSSLMRVAVARPLGLANAPVVLALRRACAGYARHLVA